MQDTASKRVQVIYVRSSLRAWCRAQLSTAASMFAVWPIFNRCMFGTSNSADGPVTPAQLHHRNNALELSPGDARGTHGRISNPCSTAVTSARYAYACDLCLVLHAIERCRCKFAVVFLSHLANDVSLAVLASTSADMLGASNSFDYPGDACNCSTKTVHSS